MKQIDFNYLGVFFALLFFMFSSCSKERKEEGFDNNSHITMLIDGKPWKSKLAFMVTHEGEEGDDEYEDYYRVILRGSNSDDRNNLGELSGFTIDLAIPKNKYKDPRGTYKFGNESNPKTNLARATFLGSENLMDIAFLTGYDDSQITYGSLTVSDFKIGQQKINGVSVGEEGYLQISGAFETDLNGMDLNNVDNNGDSKLVKMKVTNGEFNVKFITGLAGSTGLSLMEINKAISSEFNNISNENHHEFPKFHKMR